MRRRGKVIQGKFGDRHRRASGLPPELVTLLNVERKKRKWHGYSLLFGGAVAVGLVVGIAPSLIRSTPSVSPQAQPAVPVQPALEWKPSADDQQWASRGVKYADASLAAGSARTTFGFCHTGGGANCVVDGDTIWIEGVKVRVADIDAPETHDYHCAQEKGLGDQATQRLIQLVNSGSVSLQPIDRDEDIYGRKLRIVMVNGTSVGETLVSEGLARYYEGGRKPGC